MYGKLSIPNKIYRSQEGDWYILEINFPNGSQWISKISFNDVEKVKKYHWSISGPKNNQYIVCKLYKSPVIRLHRYLMNVSDPKILVDHINGDRFDNRQENLRTCTKSQNNMNRKKTPTSFLKGIHKIKNISGKISYQVRIKKDYKSYCFGTFYNLKDALECYNINVVKLHGSFAVLHEVHNA
jgi:hypothetical protein